VIKEMADAVSEDERWAPSILEAPTVLGVERMSANSLTLRLVVKTRPADQWVLQRVLRERIASAFLAEGISMPPPEYPPATKP
jgi:small conductance mechanosensitive channel